jgi:hypothetical protein
MADVSVIAASVKKTATTVIETGTAGEAVTAGQPVYLKSLDKKLWLADANGSDLTAEAVGIALNGASADHPLDYAVDGDVTFNAGLTAGTVYVVSATAGAIAPSADLDTNSTWHATVLGVASSTTNLKLSIKASRTINA